MKSVLITILLISSLLGNERGNCTETYRVGNAFDKIIVKCPDGRESTVTVNPYTRKVENVENKKIKNKEEKKQ